MIVQRFKNDQPTRTIVAAIGVLMAIPFVGCTGETGKQNEPAQKSSETVTVFAAASLKDTVETLARQFGEKNSVTVQTSVGGSNQLAAQIIEGAPADIFLSASEEWAEKVIQSNLSVAKKTTLGNRLAIVVPHSTTVSIKEPRDLAKAEIKKIALAGENVPAGKYAEQALKRLDLFPSLVEAGKIVRGGDVRVTLSYLERGEVDAGIVYVTDARVAPSVDLACVFEENLHDSIRYPMLLLKHGESNASAKRFFEYLASSDAKKVFEQAGFLIIE